MAQVETSLLQTTLSTMLGHQLEQDAMAQHDGILALDKDSWTTARLRYCLALIGDKAQWEILNNKRVELCYKEFKGGLDALEANWLGELQLLADEQVGKTKSVFEVMDNGTG